MSHERHGSQIILHSTTCWANCSGWQQRKHQRTALLVLCLRGIHWRPTDYPHKRLVTRKVVNENKNAEVSGPVKFAMASWNEITLAQWLFHINSYWCRNVCLLSNPELCCRTWIECRTSQCGRGYKNGAQSFPCGQMSPIWNRCMQMTSVCMTAYTHRTNVQLSTYTMKILPLITTFE